MCLKRWSRRSTYRLSEELKVAGVLACPNSVGHILKENNFSLRVNRKTIAETYHPDRNRQFEIMSETRKRFENAGQPIITVDSKKKELIGNFKNPGKAWCGEPEKVLNHEFRSQAVAVITPYGIYEPVHNKGTVVVGISSDTPAFAVDSIEIWLTQFAPKRYRKIKDLLILCDSGGSNGARPRMWKYALHQKICKVYGIRISVCHYPAGASKWNLADHRLFSFITKNWEGRPLRSLDIVLKCLRSTTTRKGLQVDAALNSKQYQKGIKVSESEMKEIGLISNDELPQWNYSLVP